MSTTSAVTGVHDLPAEVRRALRVVQPPLRSVRFWLVQVGVVSLALFHDVVLVDAAPHHEFSVSDAMSSALLLVPVIYAALNFGVRGAVATAIWATMLIAPHWAFMDPLTHRHLVIELGNLLVLNTVAVVVGQRVENEQQARLHAEEALQVARTASRRYRSLFEQQPSPVIIADCSGVVSEINTAATRLLGAPAASARLQDLLGLSPAELLDDDPPCLSLRTPEGERRLFVSTAHKLEVENDRRRLIQIILSDVTEQHRRQEEERQFSGRLLAVQEEQRRQLAQELHDEPLQNLVFLSRTLDDLADDPDLPDRLSRTLEHGGDLAAETTTALRKVIHGLRPPALDDIGVASALRQLAADVRARTGLPVELRCAGDDSDLSPELRLTVYRIVQEALNNVVRHADAARATVRVRFGSSVSVTVSDDGTGVPADLGTQTGPAYGLGLLGMQERATLVGGSVRISARQPRGTTVRATLPTLTDGEPAGRSGRPKSRL